MKKQSTQPSPLFCGSHTTADKPANTSNRGPLPPESHTTTAPASSSPKSRVGNLAQSSVTPEEPLLNVAYCYDATLEGLFSAVFQAYARHENPQDIAPEHTLQPRLGQTVCYIETDLSHAERVQRGIKRTCGLSAYEAVMQASLSDNPQTGSIVYQFIRYAMAQNRPHNCSGCKRQGRCSGPSNSCPTTQRHSVLHEITHPCVEPLLRLSRSVMNERHLMIQFLRFEQLENGVWLSRCNPKASVVPLLMNWFRARFGVQPFIIFDEVHHLAGVYEGSDWYLVSTKELTVPNKAANEELMQAAWKRFYRTVAVESRYNPELRRQFMPKRFWKNILEMHEDLPKGQLASSR